MQSTAETVDAYLAEQTPEVRADLERIRAMIRKQVPQAEELMQYGMPFYRTPEQPHLLAFTKQKNNYAVYVSDIPEEIRARMGRGWSLGKGCARFTKLDDDKAALLDDMIRVAVARKATC